MDLRQAGLGVVLLLVFWAFQAGYANILGPAMWFVGALIFVAVMFLIGQGAMKNPSAEMKELWTFTYVFALVAVAIFSFVPPGVLGITVPAGFSPSALTPYILSVLLAIFGGAMFVTGWLEKWNVTLLTGIVWLFVATHLYTLTFNAYIHFAFTISLPFIIYGLISKK